MSSETKFVPWKSHRYSREKVETIFGPKSNAKLAQQTHEQNPELYRELRNIAQELGLVGPQYEHPWAAMVRAREAEAEGRKFSDEEIAARSQFSEQECRELFCAPSNGSKHNAANLAKENPAKYELARRAAASYGLLPPQPNTVQRPAQRPPEPVNDGRFKLADELADRVNLPRGTRVDADQLDSIIKIIVEKNEATKTAAPQETAPVTGESK